MSLNLPDTLTRVKEKLATASGSAGGSAHRPESADGAAGAVLSSAHTL